MVICIDSLSWSAYSRRLRAHPIIITSHCERVSRTIEFVWLALPIQYRSGCCHRIISLSLEQPALKNALLFILDYNYCSTAKSCTDCGLLLQVFVGGASLKGLTESDVMQVMNRCSIIKCSHVFKPQKQLGFVTMKCFEQSYTYSIVGSCSFCLLHFKDKTDAACFYHTYASKEIPICQSLGGLYVQEAVFNGVKATYVIHVKSKI